MKCLFSYVNFAIMMRMQFIAWWLSIRGLLINKITTVGLLMQMNQLLVIECVFECLQRIGVNEIVLLWLLCVVASGWWVGVDVVGLRMFHWWALRVILLNDKRNERIMGNLCWLHVAKKQFKVSLPVHYHNLGHL